MKIVFRLFLGFAAICGLSAVVVVSQEAMAPATKMADAADKFMASLSDEQKKKAMFDFDDKHRVEWFFTPQQDNKAMTATRKGLRFEELSDAQKKLALDLLKTGTSNSGYNQAVTVSMSLENILKTEEPKKAGGMIRNPEWYFVSIFGKPSKTGKWGWRVEGHHLSVNFTIDRGQLSSVTPFFFGANPADVKDGPKKGLRTLPEIEDAARELIKSLDADQTKTAKLDKPLPEVGEKLVAAKPGDPVGLTGEKLGDKQKETLMKLIKAYTDRMPDTVGSAEYASVNEKGLGKVYFAYSGDATPGKGYTYRVHGPTFIIEFLNMQADGSGNPANHIHSVWRHLPSDFGL